MGPGDTLLACLRRLKKAEPLVVVLGDTLFELPDVPEESNWVLLNEDPGTSRRWCYAACTPDGVVTELIDKPAENTAGHDVLIGVYVVADSAPGRQALEGVPPLERRELRHFLAPYVEQGRLQGVRARQWFDCGNPDHLLNTRRRLIASRVFNDLQLDDLRGTITKRSQDSGKFLNEINYYRLLPADLQPFFPRVFDFNVRSGNLSLTTEYYGYPTLSDLWMLGELDTVLWQRVFGRLRDILDCFASYPLPIASGDVRDFYWRKTVERLEALAGLDEALAELAGRESMQINGQEVAGWPSVRAWLESEVTRAAATARGQVIHGDLCFPNILYDPLSNLFKLVDVRGSFVGAGLYGDAQYDAAKLLHSIHGGYDALIREMYTLEEQGEGEFQFRLFQPGNRAAVLDAFQTRFETRFNLRSVRVLEALLFLSMSALHQESRQRQKAMLLRGLMLIHALREGRDWAF